MRPRVSLPSSIKPDDHLPRSLLMQARLRRLECVLEGHRTSLGPRLLERLCCPARVTAHQRYHPQQGCHMGCAVVFTDLALLIPGWRLSRRSRGRPARRSRPLLARSTGRVSARRPIFEISSLAHSSSCWLLATNAASAPARARAIAVALPSRCWLL